MGDWNWTCNNEAEVYAFMKMMHSEYKPWKVLPPLVDKFPVVLDIKKVSEKKKLLKIVVIKQLVAD